MTAQIKMNLSTLLEAARYVEMQEKEQQQKRKAAEAGSQPITNNNDSTNNNKRPHNNQNNQKTTTTAQTTVLITEVQPKTILHSSLTTSMGSVMAATNHHQPKNAKITVEQPEQQPQVSSSTNLMQQAQPQQPRRFLHNSFDIINNPLGYLDDSANVSSGSENGGGKRKNPPMVFRAGTREVHNKLEKHRRAHLKECFDVLKKQLPAAPDEKKTSNLSILHSALRCIQTLKRRERELEHEMERLARDKIAAQQRLAALKKDISSKYDNVDFAKFLPEVAPPAGGSPGGSSVVVTSTGEVVGGEDVKIKIEPALVAGGVAGGTGGCQNGGEHHRVPIPLLPNKTQLSIATTTQLGGAIKAEVAQPVQTTALSVMPVGYPGLVLQKVALVSKGLTELTPLVSTHFITPQQLNGKVVPLVNAQYVVKPVVVVSRPS